jgi:hypothetical protein
MILHGIPRFLALSIAYALGLLQMTFAISTSGFSAKYSAILCKLVPPPETKIDNLFIFISFNFS